MKYLLSGFTFVTLIGACSSTQKFGDFRFTTHDDRVDGLNNIPKHGFIDNDNIDRFCDGSNRLTGGYLTHLRSPKTGESQEDYDKYVGAEKIRTSICAKASIWCATRSHYFCKPNDDDCLNKHPGAYRNTCKVKVLEPQEKPELSPISQQIGNDTWIQCGGDDDRYESTLAHIATTTKAWTKDQAKWIQLCQSHRPKEECDLILKEYFSGTWFSSPDHSRWATEILVKDKPKVERDGNRWIGTVEIDFTPACGLLQTRH